MANPATRQQLIDYCLRKLGHPVIEINVDDDQVEDRIDEAFQFFRDFHYDAVETVFLKVLVDGSNVHCTANLSNFVIGDAVTTSTGGTATITEIVSDQIINVVNMTGDFTANAIITNGLANATITSSFKGAFDNHYFEISDAVVGIKQVLPFTSKSTGMSIFDIRYQILVNDLYTLQSTDLIYYSQIKTHMELLNQLLVGQKPVRFSRHTNQLHLDMSWGIDVQVGDYIVVECTRILDPATFSDVYNDMMLKKLATALIKRQWGDNLKKFEGVQLPGGVTLNGQKIYEEAVEEIEKLEIYIRNTYELPVAFIVG